MYTETEGKVSVISYIRRKKEVLVLIYLDNFILISIFGGNNKIDNLII